MVKDRKKRKEGRKTKFKRTKNTKIPHPLQETVVDLEHFLWLHPGGSYSLLKRRTNDWPKHKLKASQLPTLIQKTRLKTNQTES